MAGIRHTDTVIYNLREPLLQNGRLLRYAIAPSVMPAARPLTADLDYALTPHTSAEDLAVLAQAQENDPGPPLYRPVYDRPSPAAAQIYRDSID